MKSGMRTLLVSAALFAFATAASSQTSDVGRALVASNSLQLKADTLRSGQAVTPPKEFIVPYAGVVRIRWQLKSDGTGLANAKVESSIGACSSSTLETTFQFEKCDLRVVAGDRIVVTAGGTFNTNTFLYSTAFIKGVRVFFNVVDATGTGLTLAD